MYEELLNFLNGEDSFFIEAEATPQRMKNFIREYNRKYNDTVTLYGTDGILLLQEDANKWGLELRLYVQNRPPVAVYSLGFAPNDTYRSGYSYRLSENGIVTFLFDQGYRIGLN